MEPQTNQAPQQPLNEPQPGAAPTPPAPYQQPVAQQNTPPQQPIAQQYQPEQPQTFSPPTPPEPLQPQMPTTPPHKRRNIIIFSIVAVLLLAGLGVAAYFLFFNTSANQAANNSTKSASSQAVDLSTLNKVTATLPGGIDSYTEQAINSTTAKDYLSDNGNCEFVVGTVTATELPGADLNAIIEPQLQKLRDDGATVSGPTSGQALIIKDASDSSITYSMPTINFDFVKGQKRVVSHYSAVILKNGDRVIVNRICKNSSGGAVDEAALAALDTKAKEVIITKQ